MLVHKMADRLVDQSERPWVGKLVESLEWMLVGYSGYRKVATTAVKTESRRASLSVVKRAD